MEEELDSGGLGKVVAQSRIPRLLGVLDVSLFFCRLLLSKVGCRVRAFLILGDFLLGGLACFTGPLVK